VFDKARMKLRPVEARILIESVRWGLIENALDPVAELGSSTNCFSASQRLA